MAARKNFENFGEGDFPKHYFCESSILVKGDSCRQRVGDSIYYRFEKDVSVDPKTNLKFKYNRVGLALAH